MISFDPPWTSNFRVDPGYPFHLVNAEGQHLFILNKTAWLYFACRYPEEVLKRAKKQGVNVLRVALEGRPYYNEAGLDLWPWGGSRTQPDWSGFNQAYWDQVEERIRLAGAYGIGLDIVLYFNLHPSEDQVALHQSYWETALNRLGHYANVFIWEIANEYSANAAFQDQAGLFFARRDPARRPVCSSDGTTDDALWPDKPWMDLAINHTCTSSTARHDLQDWYLAVARNTRSHGKPSFCNESGRESRHKNDDGIHRRKQGWLWCAAGGFWTWHSWDGCEGIDEIDYTAPGEQYLAPMAAFFRTLPFWRMTPNFTALTVSHPDLVTAVLAEPERETVLAYLCSRTSGQFIGPTRAEVRLPAGEYQVDFITPSELHPVKTQPLVSASLGMLNPLELPAFQDDLAVIIRRDVAHAAGPMPGTE